MCNILYIYILFVCMYVVACIQGIAEARGAL